MVDAQLLNRVAIHVCISWLQLCMNALKAIAPIVNRQVNDICEVPEKSAVTACWDWSLAVLTWTPVGLTCCGGLVPSSLSVQWQ